MNDEQHPFDQATTVEVRQHRDRLARVSPRITYVILCWDGSNTAFGYDEERLTRPAAILGPFTEWEATRLAKTLTCECEVTNITTEAPPWASEAFGPGTTGTGTPI